MPPTPHLFTHPDIAASQCRQLSAFAHLLQQANRIHNLTRITETERIYTRHFADSLQVLPHLDRLEGPGRLIDIGSGAGFPGLVLAIARPDWRITSLEATAKKVRFQQEVVDRLNLGNVTVRQGRAETVAHSPEDRESYDIVCSRAVSRLNILAELTLPFCRPGGFFCAFKGAEAMAELHQAREAIARLGGCYLQSIVYTLSELSQKVDLRHRDDDPSFALLIIEKTGATPRRFPRAFGVIRERPLG